MTKKLLKENLERLERELPAMELTEAQQKEANVLLDMYSCRPRYTWFMPEEPMHFPVRFPADQGDHQEERRIRFRLLQDMAERFGLNFNDLLDRRFVDETKHLIESDLFTVCKYDEKNKVFLLSKTEEAFNKGSMFVVDFFENAVYFIHKDLMVI